MDPWGTPTGTYLRQSPGDRLGSASTRFDRWRSSDRRGARVVVFGSHGDKHRRCKDDVVVPKTSHPPLKTPFTIKSVWEDEMLTAKLRCD
jgi:hypothetical protein